LAKDAFGKHIPDRWCVAVMFVLL